MPMVYDAPEDSSLAVLSLAVLFSLDTLLSEAADEEESLDAEDVEEAVL